jgi:hypothetical protein
MKKIVIIFFSTIIPFSSFCQGNGENSPKFWDKIEIKKSFDSKTDKAKPAILSITVPTGSKNYFTINGGVAYRISKLTTGVVSKKIKLDVFSVYNRNNQIKKIQNNFKAGFSLEKKVVFNDKDLIPRNFKFQANFSNEFNRNWIDTTNSFLSLLYLEPYFRIGDKLKFGEPVMSKSGNILSYLKAIPGLEYQNKFDIPVSDTKGSLSRLFFAASYEWYLRWRQKPGDINSDWVNMIELSANYIYRNDFYNNTDKKEGYLPLLVFAAGLYPFHNDNISFGVTYQNGSDPINGIDDQEFWQFVFKFKKDIKKK